MKRGKIHDYLVMNLENTQPGQVRVSMKPYVTKKINELPEEIRSETAATSVADYFFKVWSEQKAQKLPEEQVIQFYHVVEQLLFTSNRARRDIQTAVAFLTTRVKGPDEDDWEKLRRFIKYLNGTRNLELRLSINNIGSFKLYVDASYAIHGDCKGHTGALMMIGSGAISSFS